MSEKSKRKHRAPRDCQLCHQHAADVAGVCWQCIDTARAAGRCPDCTSVITVAVVDRDNGPLVVCECQHDRTCPSWQVAKLRHSGADFIMRTKGGPL